ncbi:AbrB/MazE/SpoVT family DNA-binding domain-containing protein [Cohnella abietis]|uniref:AbrB family transcriptional regulator n=1 Tax=Cohnella abietis TaxID=2507935 RepID=A0A3T1D2K8_9BACL|nr:AbrB/MazE/SpoVT family DNA-binding domain-containing protein [Cohnella abietis]BBI32340.1 AbrB family transcriptional regulator [Cohnella abietis]
MKATGIVRRIDDLGRVVIPKEMRRTLGVANGDPIEFFVEGDRIILRKYNPGCVMCGSVTDVKELRGKSICASCVSEIVESVGARV